MCCHLQRSARFKTVYLFFFVSKQTSRWTSKSRFWKLQSLLLQRRLLLSKPLQLLSVNWLNREKWVLCAPCVIITICFYCSFSEPTILSVRCNLHILRLCYDVSVRLSVVEVHWHIIANLAFKFRSQFTTHCGRGACGRAQGKGS